MQGVVLLLFTNISTPRSRLTESVLYSLFFPLLLCADKISASREKCKAKMVFAFITEAKPNLDKVKICASREKCRIHLSISATQANLDKVRISFGAITLQHALLFKQKVCHREIAEACVFCLHAAKAVIQTTISHIYSRAMAKYGDRSQRLTDGRGYAILTQ